MSANPLIVGTTENVGFTQPCHPEYRRGISRRTHRAYSKRSLSGTRDDGDLHFQSHSLIAVTPGEPAGVGPDIICQLAHENPDLPIVVIADPDLLHKRAQQLGFTWPEKIAIIPVKMALPCEAGQPNVKNVPYVLDTLTIAHEGCITGKYSALVTGPVHKGLINDAGIPFEGHTQFLAQLNACKTLMLFIAPTMRVALATTHLPLKDVPKKIDASLLTECIKILSEGLTHYFSIKNPRISVCGLNPHAGEGGHMGREEQDIIIPLLKQLREKSYSLTGPVPADTAFTPDNLEHCDAVLAMYHDQALPVLKALGFGEAVNVTLGLPYLRTSVDHGTAFELAGTHRANTRSFKKALALAITLTSQ
jgi:4-hydroxythreonine-4-phosphate dehydrogenase